MYTYTITQKYFYITGQKSRKLHSCPIQQMQNSGLNPLKGQNTVLNFLKCRFHSSSISNIAFCPVPPNVKSTPIRQCCPISFGNSRAWTNATSIKILSIGPLWIIQSGSCIKKMRPSGPLFLSSLLLHQSFLLRSHDFHGNAQQRLLELQNSMRKSKKVEERKREWCLRGKWAPHSSCDSCAVVSLTRSKQSSPSLFLLLLSLSLYLSNSRAFSRKPLLSFFLKATVFFHSSSLAAAWLDFNSKVKLRCSDSTSLMPVLPPSLHNLIWSLLSFSLFCAL